MLGCLFVAAFHIEQREVGVDELLVGTKFLRLVPLCNRRHIVSLAIIGHAERELRVEVRRVFCKNRFQLGNRSGEIARAEIEHRVVILLVQSHLFRRHANARLPGDASHACCALGRASRMLPP